MGYLRNRGSRQAPIWYMRFLDADGRWKQRKAKGAATKEQARALLLEAEHRVQRGLMGVPTPTADELGRQALTVDDLAARFLGDVDGEPGYAPPRLKSLDGYRSDVRSHLAVRVGPHLGKRLASSVTPLDVERLRDALLAGGLAAASVMQTLAILSKVYNWARRDGLVDCANPVSGVDRPRPAPSLDYLSAPEVGRLLATARSMARFGVGSWQALTLWPMVACALYCGLRKGELYGLRWSDVDLVAGRLDVWRSYQALPKSGKPRHVPINPELARILEPWKKVCPATPEGLVFPVEGSPGVFRMGAEFGVFGLPELLELAGCHQPADGHPWHFLRHSFAAHAVMSGTSLYAVQRLLGHSTPVMTQRYAHLAPDFMAAEVARMSFEPK